MATTKKNTTSTEVDDTIVEKEVQPVQEVTKIIERIIERPAPSSNINHELKMQERERKRKALAQTYKAEEKVMITIAPFYRPYLGRVVRIAVNGIAVFIPANGNAYAVNATHAGELTAKLKYINNLVQRQERAANVNQNFEHTPGELVL